jgi:integrase/recombinase XerC
MALSIRAGILRRAYQEVAQRAEWKSLLAEDLRVPARVRALRDGALLALSLDVGLRVSEVCALRLDDVVLNDRSGYLTVRSGKRGKYREIPLNAGARKALRAWLEVRPEVDANVVFTGRKL